MLLMFENGIQVRITQATKRHAKLNNKCMTEQCNLDEKSPCLQYLDASNLNGGTMFQKLLTHGFKWEVKVGDFTSEKIHQPVKRADKGMMIIEGRESTLAPVISPLTPSLLFLVRLFLIYPEIEF